MRVLRRSAAAFVAAALAAMSLSSVASAAPLSSSPFGETAPAGGGATKLISDYNPGHTGYGGLDYALPGASIGFGDIKVLQTSLLPDPGDDCGAGSPRYQLNVDTNGDGGFDGNVFVYTGFPTPFNCPFGGDTGNLIGTGGRGDIVGTYDLSQIGGSGYTDYTSTAAFFAAHPGYRIIGIQIVVDSGWNAAAAGSDGREAITVNSTVDVNLGAASNKEQCKSGGWRFLTRADGSAFKNQGDCVSYANNGK